jgi:hypothetical protein
MLVREPVLLAKPSVRRASAQRLTKARSDAGTRSACPGHGRPLEGRSCPPPTAAWLGAARPRDPMGAPRRRRPVRPSVC